MLLAETAARETLSPVERLEIMLHPWVGFAIMPLFAFANGLQEPEESRYGSCICRIRTWQAHGYFTLQLAGCEYRHRDTSPESGLGIAGRRRSPHRHRLHYGTIHCQPGFQPKPDKCGQIGYFVSINRFCYDGYRDIGMVVTA